MAIIIIILLFSSHLISIARDSIAIACLAPARNCSNSLNRTGICAIAVAECRSEPIGPRTTARSTGSFNRIGGSAARPVFGLWQLTVLVESHLRRAALAWALQVALHCGARVSVRGDDSVARAQAKSVEAGAGRGGWDWSSKFAASCKLESCSNRWPRTRGPPSPRSSSRRSA
jgi:hypothetical protein